MTSFANRVHRARLNAGLTQTQLAGLVGVQRGAVSQWERAAGTIPSVANLSKIAIVTEVRFDWLATGRGAMRIGRSHQTPALVSQDFAQDELESRLLIGIRRMRNRRKRQAIVAMVEVLGN